jgi:hypothetical protein
MDELKVQAGFAPADGLHFEGNFSAQRRRVRPAAVACLIALVA